MDVHLFFVCLILVTSNNIIKASKVVTLKDVDIVGNVKAVDLDGISYNVNEYLGMPYAKAPIGDLRFSKPEPLDSLESPFNATKYGAVCPQIVTGILSKETWNQSEDCLSINVFVPERSPDSIDGHAVMVWIYGGGFSEGSAITYDGTFLAAYGNVIVVTFNYRLNVFGFLSTNDDEARGNFGLWDQKMALHWVHDNIQYFGGDNNRVTIFGESAGAVSCFLNSLYPDNFGLFQRVIAESGSPTIPGYVSVRDGLSDARLIAEKVGCDDDSTKEMISCLRSRHWKDILASAIGIQRFVPLVDGEFITTDPHSLVSKTTESDEIIFFRSMDILSGFNKYDGALMLLYTMDAGQLEYFQPTKEMKMTILQGIVTMSLRKNYPEEIIKMIDGEYTSWKNASDGHEIRLSIVKLLSDVMFVVPAMEMAHLHKASEASGRHHVYIFTPKPPFHVFPTPSWIDGASHADELAFVFGIEYMVPELNVNNWEAQLSRGIMTYWTNFAKSGYIFSLYKKLPQFFLRITFFSKKLRNFKSVYL